MTEVGLVLLASNDPVTIQQFSDALGELSISPDVCREVPAAVGLLNRRKFDAVIIDLQLGEQAGLILNEVRLSPSNQKAVTFAISGSDAEGIALRKKSEFVFERPLSWPATALDAGGNTHLCLHRESPSCGTPLSADSSPAIGL